MVPSPLPAVATLHPGCDLPRQESPFHGADDAPEQPDTISGMCANCTARAQTLPTHAAFVPAVAPGLVAALALDSGNMVQHRSVIQAKWWLELRHRHNNIVNIVLTVMASMCMVIPVAFDQTDARVPHLSLSIMYCLLVMVTCIAAWSFFDSHLLWTLFTNSFLYLVTLGNVCLFLIASLAELNKICSDASSWIYQISRRTGWCFALLLTVSFDAFPSRRTHQRFVRAAALLVFLNCMFNYISQRFSSDSLLATAILLEIGQFKTNTSSIQQATTLSLALYIGRYLFVTWKYPYRLFALQGGVNLIWTTADRDAPRTNGSGQGHTMTAFRAPSVSTSRSVAIEDPTLSDAGPLVLDHREGGHDQGGMQISTDQQLHIPVPDAPFAVPAVPVVSNDKVVDTNSVNNPDAVFLSAVRSRNADYRCFSLFDPEFGAIATSDPTTTTKFNLSLHPPG